MCILSVDWMGEWGSASGYRQCLSCGWLNVCMAFVMNENLRRVAFVKGTINLPLLSISRESNSGLKGCVSSDKIFISRSVSRLWSTESKISCCLSITPPAFLMVFFSLSLSCFEAFPPQQTQPKVRTLLIVDKKNLQNILTHSEWSRFSKTKETRVDFLDDLIGVFVPNSLVVYN